MLIAICKIYNQKKLINNYLMNRVYKNILVTGGSGFIGSNFIHHLIEESDANIFNLDKLTYLEIMQII